MGLASNRADLMRRGIEKQRKISARNGKPFNQFITIHFNDFAVPALQF
jgi:hypothetical protein